MAFSCSEEMSQDQAVGSDERVPITFSASFDTTTRGSIIGSDEFKSFTLYAYEVDSDIAFINGATFTKDDNGVWSSTDSYYWPTDTTTQIEFYAYTPAEANATNGISFSKGVIAYNMSDVDNANLPDITTAYSKQASGSVSLSFTRNVAILQFKDSGAANDIASISVSSIVDNGSLDIEESTWSTSSASSTSYSAGLKSIDSETTSITADNGYIMVIPQTTSNVIFTATDEDENSKDYTLESVTWEANKIYTYAIDSDGIVAEEGGDTSSSKDVTLLTSTNDYTNLVASNCYIINPMSSQRVYHIPIEGRINTYWTDYDPQEDYQITDTTRAGVYVEQLWSDCGIAAEGGENELTVGLAMKDGVKIMQVVVPADYATEGNAVYAVKNSEGVIIWSWHLWVTDYAPTSTYLNRFVGQKATADSSWGSTTGVMLYQFGRKDPFVIDSSNSSYSANKTGTVSLAINNPDVIYGTNNTLASVWSYSTSSTGYTNSGISLGNSIIWGDRMTDYSSNSKAKSIYDPSPYGYRLPYSEASDLASFNKKAVTAYTSSNYLSCSNYYFSNLYGAMVLNNSNATSQMESCEANIWTSRYNTQVSSYYYYFRIARDTSYASASYVCTYGYAKDLMAIFPIKM